MVMELLDIVIKEGIHKGTVLGHITREKSGLEN
jgi:hypothetical protein